MGVFRLAAMTGPAALSRSTPRKKRLTMADDPRVTKRRVTMRSAALNPDGVTVMLEAVDFVRPDFLDAYVADAKRRWQVVQVSDVPDAGPAGYEGATHVPAHLDHPLAGQTFPAASEG